MRVGWMGVLGKDLLLAFAHPLGHDVPGADGEEAVCYLCGDGLGEVALACTGRSVEKDCAGRFASLVVEVGEPGREDDGALELMLGWHESCNIVPLDIGLLGNDGAHECFLVGRVLGF